MWRAYSGLQVGRTGDRGNNMEASRGVRFAFFWLQSRQANTQFSQVLVPPRDRGCTWSIVSSSVPGRAPQY